MIRDLIYILLLLSFYISSCQKESLDINSKESFDNYRVLHSSTSYFPIKSVYDFDSVVANGYSVLKHLQLDEIDSLRTSLSFNTNGFLNSFRYDVLRKLDSVQLVEFFGLFGMTLTPTEQSSAYSAIANGSGEFTFTDWDNISKTSKVAKRCKVPPDCSFSLLRVCIFANCN
jgi:hypothetical protein